jgi:hypothetical protein
MPDWVCFSFPRICRACQTVRGCTCGVSHCHLGLDHSVVGHSLPTYGLRRQPTRSLVCAFYLQHPWPSIGYLHSSRFRIHNSSQSYCDIHTDFPCRRRKRAHGVVQPWSVRRPISIPWRTGRIAVLNLQVRLDPDMVSTATSTLHKSVCFNFHPDHVDGRPFGDPSGPWSWGSGRKRSVRPFTIVV